MPALSTKLFALVAALAVFATVMPGALANDAKPRKYPHKKAVVAKRAKTETQRCRGANLFPCGPIYNGQDYLGDDPDPFIRSQILRDLGARYGGESD